MTPQHRHRCVGPHGHGAPVGWGASRAPFVALIPDTGPP